MKKIIIFLFISSACLAVAYCEQASRIELTDGSVINGEVVSFANGVYTINTATLGSVKIESAKISKIQTVNPPLTNTPHLEAVNLSQRQIEAYRQKIAGNPQNAAVITGLANNPQVQGLAQDPQIQEAAKSGDIQALLKNEKFMQVVNDPELQETVKKLKQ